MDELSFYRKNSILANLCKDWNGRWAACHGDKDKLMRLVLARQAAPHFATFCYNGAGLSKEYCLREFGDYVNGRIFNDVDGVEGFTSCMYVDASESLKIASDTTQLLWCDNVDVTVPATKCPALYISNRSVINLNLEGFNIVSVYLFDESVLNVEDADQTCEVIVYKYSSRAEVNVGKFCFGAVKTFNKQLRL